MEHVARVEQLCDSGIDVRHCILHVLFRGALRSRGVRIIVMDGRKLTDVV